MALIPIMDWLDQLLTGFYNAKWQVTADQAIYYREIVGNAFTPPRFETAWRTSDVVALAKGIFEDRAFDRMPILADALEDAGCGEPSVLAHCRGDDPHVRGCWVVDLVLGKS